MVLTPCSSTIKSTECKQSTWTYYLNRIKFPKLICDVIGFSVKEELQDGMSHTPHSTFLPFVHV